MAKKHGGRGSDKSAYLSDEDIELWNRVARSVKPINIFSKSPDKSLEQEFAQLLGEDPLNIKPAMNKSQACVGKPRDSASVRAKAPTTIARLAAPPAFFKYRNNKLSLDVHNMTEQQAYESIKTFLVFAQQRGEAAVLIITGKGSPSLGTGVINKNLPRWLDTAFFRNIVRSVRLADIADGGAGAYYVNLKV